VISSAGFRDTPKKESPVAKSDLKHYQDAKGRVFSVTEADAKKLGYQPVDFGKVKADQKAADDAVKGARLSEREKALAEGEAKLKADREAFDKAQVDAKAKGK
jgi:hypothetical protein